MPRDIAPVIKLLNEHHDAFYAVAPLAEQTRHPVPMDTRGWSQILVSVLTGINGIARKKGADLEDGSDVKGANTWLAIDTPRFNGVIKAGTLAETAGSIKSLDGQPYLFLVLWDHDGNNHARCRIWVVRTQHDAVFRRICERWYQQKKDGDIVSNNFQLHPPRGRDHNVIRNSCGNLEYPLLFCATRAPGASYVVKTYDENILNVGVCRTLP